MFSKKCFCKENVSKIVRPLLAALSVNVLTSLVLSCLFITFGAVMGKELEVRIIALFHIIIFDFIE